MLGAWIADVVTLVYVLMLLEALDTAGEFLLSLVFYYTVHDPIVV